MSWCREQNLSGDEYFLSASGSGQVLPGGLGLFPDVKMPGGTGQSLPASELPADRPLQNGQAFSY